MDCHFNSGAAMKVICWLKCRTEKCRAWWDIAAVFMPLIGAWLFFLVGVPDLITNLLADEHGNVITTEKGVAIALGYDPKTVAALHHYYSYAIPAIILTAIGALIQVRHSLAKLISKTSSESPKEQHAAPDTPIKPPSKENIFKRFMKSSFFWAIAGLVLTLIGAVVTASGVIMSDGQATLATTLNWDEQTGLKEAFLDASHATVWGLLFVAVGSICQAISLILGELKSCIRRSPVPTATIEGSMIDVYRIPVPKDKLRAMPKEERALLITLGYMANNITMLTKLIIFSTNKTPNGAEQLASAGQSQMVTRLLIGYLHESWMVIEKLFKSSPLNKKYTPLLDQKGKAALDSLNKNFSTSNLMAKLRNLFIFHLPKDVESMDKAFELAAADARLDKDWFWLFARSNLNSFYYLNDLVVMHAIMEEIGETDLIAAQLKIMAEVQKVGLDLVEFSMDLTKAIWKENFGNFIDAEVIEKITTAPKFDEHWHPFYVDEPGDTPPAPPK
jgi:hypothetical protein